ncbi:MAG: hypothetical protein OXF11_07460 [Deltaproteobacteria bacterium]|nr:hypothetical protein [Deltaproteobacteria bacterium]
MTKRPGMNDIAKLALHSDGPGRSRMLRVAWFDLGQLHYCLDRGRSVVDGVFALMHITFSTRVFWTEVAFTERRGLSKRLRPKISTPD